MLFKSNAWFLLQATLANSYQLLPDKHLTNKTHVASMQKLLVKRIMQVIPFLIKKIIGVCLKMNVKFLEIGVRKDSKNQDCLEKEALLQFGFVSMKTDKKLLLNSFHGNLVANALTHQLKSKLTSCKRFLKLPANRTERVIYLS